MSKENLNPVEPVQKTIFENMVTNAQEEVEKKVVQRLEKVPHKFKLYIISLVYNYLEFKKSNNNQNSKDYFEKELQILKDCIKLLNSFGILNYETAAIISAISKNYINKLGNKEV